ncbi:MAG TPA: alpha/beta hydrolase [Bryobacteraceae bacterium]|nr:alpha/beta hydrolase [Bryobacteraceae bacterium]
MPLHPQCKAVLDAMAAQGGKPIEESTPAEVRASRAKMADAMAALAGPEQPVARVEDRTIRGPGGPIPVRVYSPVVGRRLPALVYLHGGGWVFGNIGSVDRNCRALANSVECVVLNVEYRLAPEHKFPAAAEDAYAVLAHLAAHPQELDIDPSRIAIGGDSAGGNLAAVACLMARDRGGPRPVFQLLVYPVTDYDCERPSTSENDGYLLNRAVMRYFWHHYVASPEEARRPYASPINAKELAGLPSALVITAECDPLRDQGEAYARRLEAAGVPVTLKRYDGAIHVFFVMGAVIDAGREALADAAAALRRAFAASAGAEA